MAADRPASLPTVHGIKWTCSNGNSSPGFSVEQLVQQILDSHQTKPQPRTHNCLCTGSLGERGGPRQARGHRGRCRAAGVRTTRGEGEARSQATAPHPRQLSLVLPSGAGGAGGAGGQPTSGRRGQFLERQRPLGMWAAGSGVHRAGSLSTSTHNRCPPGPGISGSSSRSPGPRADTGFSGRSALSQWDHSSETSCFHLCLLQECKASHIFCPNVSVFPIMVSALGNVVLYSLAALISYFH